MIDAAPFTKTSSRMVVVIALLCTALVTSQQSAVAAPSCFGLAPTHDFSNRAVGVYFQGGTGRQVVVGSPHADTILGKDGNDVLCGGGGADTIYGGNGDDLIFGGVGADLLYGAIGNDTINGGDGHDTLDGASGNDTINGGNHKDTIRGGTGNDVLRGDAGLDTISGDDGNDTIGGGAHNDVLNGDAGNDTITGWTGDDRLNGGAGNDTLNGGAGDDRISGVSGTNTISGGTDNDTINGGSGVDTISGGFGNDRIWGGRGDDTIRGDSGNDELRGDQGDDALFGGDGNDYLGEYEARMDGAETLRPGRGCDTVEWGFKSVTYANGTRIQTDDYFEHYDSCDTYLAQMVTRTGPSIQLPAGVRYEFPLLNRSTRARYALGGVNIQSHWNDVGWINCGETAYGEGGECRTLYGVEHRDDDSRADTLFDSDYLVPKTDTQWVRNSPSPSSGWTVMHNDGVGFEQCRSANTVYYLCSFAAYEIQAEHPGLYLGEQYTWEEKSADLFAGFKCGLALGTVYVTRLGTNGTQGAGVVIACVDPIVEILND